MNRLNNEMFGSILILETAVGLLTEVITLFFGLVMFTAFQNGEINTYILQFGLGQLFLGLFYYMRRMFLTTAGQKLCNVYGKIKLNLQKFMGSHKLEDMENIQLNILIDQFSVAAPIRPYDVYNLNYASGFSVDGLMITYIIVLLQFKLA